MADYWAMAEAIAETLKGLRIQLMSGLSLPTLRLTLDRFDQQLFELWKTNPLGEIIYADIEKLLLGLEEVVFSSLEIVGRDRFENEFQLKHLSDETFTFAYLSDIFSEPQVVDIENQSSLETWLSVRGITAEEFGLMVERLQTVHGVSELKASEGETPESFRKIPREIAIFQKLQSWSTEAAIEPENVILQVYRQIMLPFAFEMERAYLSK